MRIVRKNKSEYPITVNVERSLIYSKISFYTSVRFLLIIAQFFGVMPLHGLGKDYSMVHFKWKNLKVFYSFINAAGGFIGALFWIAKFCVNGLYVHQTAHLCFYICTFFGNVFLIKLATNWSLILKEWSNVETTMRGYKYPTDLKKTFVVVTFGFLGIGTVEHILYILNGVSEAKKCPYYYEDAFKGFFRISFQNYFSLVTYSEFTAVLVKFSNTIATFTWIFLDLLIALTSIALTAKFQQIVMRLRDCKVKHEKFWKEIRQDYHKLYHLFCVVEKNFSALVLISYTQNIYFLCIQLYNSLRDRTSTIESVYFFYSFGFLVMRLVAVSLYGAWLYEEARKPLFYLHTVSTEHYTTDVSLFIGQICSTPIGLSGFGLFLITKNFLLQVAGTIITFELMVFQFAPIKDKGNNVTDCELSI